MVVQEELIDNKKYLNIIYNIGRDPNFSLKWNNKSIIILHAQIKTSLLSAPTIYHFLVSTLRLSLNPGHWKLLAYPFPLPITSHLSFISPLHPRTLSSPQPNSPHSGEYYSGANRPQHLVRELEKVRQKNLTEIYEKI